MLFRCDTEEEYNKNTKKRKTLKINDLRRYLVYLRRMISTKDKIKVSLPGPQDHRHSPKELFKLEVGGTTICGKGYDQKKKKMTKISNKGHKYSEDFFFLYQIHENKIPLAVRYICICDNTIFV